MKIHYSESRNDFETSQSSLLIRRSFAELFDVLGDENTGKIIRGALEYISTGEIPQFSDRDSRLAWALMRPVIDSDQRRYYERIRAERDHLETMSEEGSKDE